MMYYLALSPILICSGSLELYETINISSNSQNEKLKHEEWRNLPKLLVNGGTGIQTPSLAKIHNLDHYFSLLCIQNSLCFHMG